MEKIYRVKLNSKGMPNFSTAVEIPQGEWIKPYGDSRFMCSICKGKENVPTCMGKPSVWDYCPNCGCRMKGADDE